MLQVEQLGDLEEPAKFPGAHLMQTLAAKSENKPALQIVHADCATNPVVAE